MKTPEGHMPEEENIKFYSCAVGAIFRFAYPTATPAEQ